LRAYNRLHQEEIKVVGGVCWDTQVEDISRCVLVSDEIGCGDCFVDYGLYRIYVILSDCHRTRDDRKLTPAQPFIPSNTRFDVCLRTCQATLKLRGASHFFLGPSLSLISTFSNSLSPPSRLETSFKDTLSHCSLTRDSLVGFQMSRRPRVTFSFVTNQCFNTRRVLRVLPLKQAPNLYRFT
jgi:hypothetical protein